MGDFWRAAGGGGKWGYREVKESSEKVFGVGVVLLGQF